MPSPRRQKPPARPVPRKGGSPHKAAAKKPARPTVRKLPPSKPTPKSTRPVAAKSAAKGKAAPAPVVPVVRRSDGRVHLLSLSFVRDGDEFLARMETDSGQITELKNRALDQLLTLVASELEDLLE
jgi:hypothetical protein